MVFFNDKKFACQTCIKGHRSSGCRHTDRPLYEIKKKGRPITQCEHCRELRKTKQVHVRCQCDNKEEVSNDPNGSGKKGTGTMIPAFPNGLDFGDVDMDSVADVKPTITPPACSCQSTGDCHCWTPRHKIRRENSKTSLMTLMSPTDTSAQLPPIASAFMSPTMSPIPPSFPSQRSSIPTEFIAASDKTMKQTSSDFSSPMPTSPPPPSTSERNRHRAPFQSPTFSPATPNANTVYMNHPPPMDRYEGRPASSSPYYQAPAEPQQSYPDEAWMQPAQSSNPICNCGASCACVGCAEHVGYDGLPSASMFCGAACASGSGSCSNSNRSAIPSSSAGYDNSNPGQELRMLTPNPQVPGSPHMPDGMMGSPNSSTFSSVVSFQSFAATMPSNSSIMTTTSVSSLNPAGGGGYAWSAAQSEEDRRTGFEVSGEREREVGSCCGGGGAVGAASGLSSKRTSVSSQHSVGLGHGHHPYAISGHSHTRSNSSAASYDGMPQSPHSVFGTPSVVSVNSLPSPPPQSRGVGMGLNFSAFSLPQKHRSEIFFPFSNSSSLSEGDRARSSRSAAVKRSFKKLLPRPIAESANEGLAMDYAMPGPLQQGMNQDGLQPQQAQRTVMYQPASVFTMPYNTRM